MAEQVACLKSELLHALPVSTMTRTPAVAIARWLVPSTANLVQDRAAEDKEALEVGLGVAIQACDDTL
jgi:hypothetical protein